MMEKRSDDLNLPYGAIDQSLVQIEKRLEIQIKPIAQWFTHIDRLCNEVDNTASDIFDSDKELADRTLYQPFSRLSSQGSHSKRHSCNSLEPIFKQLQDLALEAQKEVYKLKSQLQKEAPTTGLK